MWRAGKWGYVAIEDEMGARIVVMHIQVVSCVCMELMLGVNTLSNIRLRILFSNTLSPCPPLNVWDHASHPRLKKFSLEKVDKIVQLPNKVALFIVKIKKKLISLFLFQ